MTIGRECGPAKARPRVPDIQALLRCPAGTDTLLVNRYEFKYLIPPRLVQPTRDFIRPFVLPDRFADSQSESSYSICSLYFDTANLELCRKTLRGEKNRYKLRIRSYSEEPDQPVFLEVKRRIDAMVMKRRCRVSRTEALAILGRDSCPVLDLTSELRAGVDEFLTLAAAGARPVLRVKYQREAYEARGPEPVRITLDTDLWHAVSPALDLSHNGSGWCRTPVDGVVLEIKFTEQCPSWVAALVRALDLGRLSVPKYCLSMVCAVREGRYRSPHRSDLDGVLAGTA